MDPNPHAPFGSQFCELVFGLQHPGTADERMVHVSELSRTERGDRCGCVCPACAAPIRAHLGEKVRRHFRHRVERTPEQGGRCTGAPETALHIYAKQVVVDALRLRLPDAVAEFAGRQQIAWQGREVHFSHVVPEQTLQSVRPDLVAHWGEIEIWVEIFVTHETKGRKLALAREQDQPLLEIDLTTLARDADPAEIRQAVLDGSRAHWLHHPRVPPVLAELKASVTAEEARQAEAEEAARQKAEARMQRLEEALRTPWDEDAPLTQAELDVHEAGLDHLISGGWPGERCFRVPPRVWQSALLSRLLLQAPDVVVPVKDLFQVISGYRHPEVARLTKEQRAHLAEQDDRFTDPWHTMRDYLATLGGLVASTRGGVVVLSDDAKRRVGLQRDRMRQLSTAYVRISALAEVPQTQEVPQEIWEDLLLPGGSTPRQVAIAGGKAWDGLLTQLRQIWTVLKRGQDPSAIDEAVAEDRYGFGGIDLLFGPAVRRAVAEWTVLVSEARRRRDQDLLAAVEAEIQPLLGQAGAKAWLAEQADFVSDLGTKADHGRLQQRVSALQARHRQMDEIRQAMRTSALEQMPSPEAVETWIATAVDPYLKDAPSLWNVAEVLRGKLGHEARKQQLAQLRLDMEQQAGERLAETLRTQWIAEVLDIILAPGEVSRHSVTDLRTRLQRILDDWVAMADRDGLARSLYGEVMRRVAERRGEDFNGSDPAMEAAYQAWRDTPLRYGQSPLQWIRSPKVWSDFEKDVRQAMRLMDPYVPAQSEPDGWLPPVRTPDAATMLAQTLGLPLEAEVEARYALDVAAKAAFDQAKLAELTATLASVMSHAEAVDHLRERRAAPDAPLHYPEYTMLQTHVARVLRDSAEAEWRQGMVDALQVLAAGRGGEPSKWTMRITQVMTGTPISEEDLADLQVELGHPIALPPESAAEARRETALTGIKATLMKLLGTDDGEDYWAAVVKPTLGHVLHPRELDRVITRQRDTQARLTLTGARIRMANTLREDVLAQASRLGVGAALTGDWQADHLDPAVEAVQTGRSTRRAALNGLLRRLGALTPAT